jgi:hypothetical protein
MLQTVYEVGKIDVALEQVRKATGVCMKLHLVYAGVPGMLTDKPAEDGGPTPLTPPDEDGMVPRDFSFVLHGSHPSSSPDRSSTTARAAEAHDTSS